MNINKFGTSTLNVLPKNLDLQELQETIDENVEEKVHRQMKDEEFRRREERRRNNEQLKMTDEQLQKCFPALASDLKKREHVDIQKEMDKIKNQNDFDLGGIETDPLSSSKVTSPARSIS